MEARMLHLQAYLVNLPWHGLSFMNINRSFHYHRQCESNPKPLPGYLLLMVAGLLFMHTACNAQTPVEKFGKLKVVGNKIVDQQGNPVQLRGMSLFWSQWIGKYYNYETVKWLRDDWNCSVVRAAMAVDNGGYATNPEAEKYKVIAVVDETRSCLAPSYPLVCT